VFLAKQGREVEAMKNKSISQKIPYIILYNHSICLALVIGFIICLTTDCMGERKSDHLKYEIPQVIIARDVLPPELRMGKNYSVRGVTAETTDTSTQGFTHRFEITSFLGNFEAHCVDMLKVRIHEIQVISALQNIKKTKTFSDALKKAGNGPYKNSVDLIKRPVGTISGMPKGRWRFIARSGEIVKGGGEGEGNVPDEVILDFFKLKRLYAYKLGVDVYSTNKVLQKELNSVALTGFASGTGTSLLFSEVRKSADGLLLTGPEGLIIERTPFLEEVEKIVFENNPDDLQLINRNKLKQIGVEDAVIEEFIKHPEYSPHNRTIIVHALANMKGVKNRDNLINQAISAEHEEIALFYQYMAEMIFSYHKDVNPIIDIIPVRKSVVCYISNKDIVATLPVDHLYWTKTTDLFVTDILQLTESEDRPVKKVIIGISGTATKLAKEVLTYRGIVIKEDM
jgi:hypothetical protein